MRRSVLSGIRCCCVLMSLVASAKAIEAGWLVGTVVEVSPNPLPLSGHATSRPKMTKVFTYAIRAGDGVHYARHKARSPVATIDSPVQYSLWEKYLYIKDPAASSIE
jgi:hypothetical protein